MSRGNRLLIAATCAMVLASGNPASAAPGDFDPTFGRQGKVRIRISNGRDWARAVVVQPDGKIVAVGASQAKHPSDEDLDVAVVRLLPDGAIDSSFGSGGTVRIGVPRHTEFGEAVALQPDGRIVIAGTTYPGPSLARFVVARLNPDGSLDRRFARTGIVKTSFPATPRFGGSASAYAVLVAADGTIVVGGAAGPGAWALARYRPDGQLDRTFGRRGRATIAGTIGRLHGIAEQADGAIVAGGESFDRFTVGRVLRNGRLDPTFGDGGIAATPFGEHSGYVGGLALTSDGKIVAAGTVESGRAFSDPVVARYLADGRLDPSFGSGGSVRTQVTPDPDYGEAVLVHPDGRILVAGYTEAGSELFVLARYLSDGRLDPSFGRGGLAGRRISGYGAAASGVALQGLDRVIAAGVAFDRGDGLDVAIARFEY